MLKGLVQGLTGWLIFMGVVCVVIVSMIATWAGFAPWVEDAKREINQNTQQYQETQVAGIRDQMIKYDQNEVTLANLGQNPEENTDTIAAVKKQQAGILRFINEQVRKINPNAIPDDVADFINNNS